MENDMFVRINNTFCLYGGSLEFDPPLSEKEIEELKAMDRRASIPQWVIDRVVSFDGEYEECSPNGCVFIEEYAQCINMTDEEKFNSYMKLSKKELVQLMIERDRLIDSLSCSKTNVSPWWGTHDPSGQFTGPTYTTIS